MAWCDSVTALEVQTLLSGYAYQPDLTRFLDSIPITTNFNEYVAELIVLWKTDRFATIPCALSDRFLKVRTSSNLCKSINKLCQANSIHDGEGAFAELLKVDGIAMPMASTIMRFRRPDLFPIIDRRAYTVLFGKAPYVAHPQGQKQLSPLVIGNQWHVYRRYLDKVIECRLTLKNRKIDVAFKDMDRLLYMAGK